MILASAGNATEESADLYAGAAKAVSILESEPGARVMIIISCTSGAKKKTAVWGQSSDWPGQPEGWPHTVGIA